MFHESASSFFVAETTATSVGTAGVALGCVTVSSSEKRPSVRVAPLQFCSSRQFLFCPLRASTFHLYSVWGSSHSAAGHACPWRIAGAS